MTTLNPIQLKPEDLCVIEGLAKETSCPMEEVEKIYAEVFRGLSSGARIRDYLIVLTSKKVHDALRQTRGFAMSRDSAAHRPEAGPFTSGDPSSLSD